MTNSRVKVVALIRSACACCVLGLIAAPVARAAYSTSVSAQAAVGFGSVSYNTSFTAFGNSQVDSHSTDSAPGSASDGALAQPLDYSYDYAAPWDGSIYPFSGSAQGAASASAGQGKLHASAVANNRVTPIKYDATNDGDYVQIQNGLVSKAVVKADTSFTDVVHVMSSLPYGTPVQVQLSGTLDSSVSDPAAAYNFTGYYYSTLTYVSANFSAHSTTVTGSNTNASVGFLNGAGYAVNGGPTANLNGSFTRTDILSTYVGAEIDISCSLHAQAVGVAGFSQPPYTGVDSAVADAGNTGILNLDVITPGVTLSSDSGTNYATAVPEPGSVAMIGILALAAFRRRPSRCAE